MDPQPFITLYRHIKTTEQRIIIQPYGDWYTGRRWVGCYICYSDEGPGWAVASVPTSYYPMWHYNCLCILKG